MEVEIDLCCHKPRNAKDCWKLPEARRKQGRILSKSLQKERGSVDTLIADF